MAWIVVSLSDLLELMLNKRGMTYISPYNDSQVICGQGKLATELTQQLTISEKLNDCLTKLHWTFNVVQVSTRQN